MNSTSSKCAAMHMCVSFFFSPCGRNSLAFAFKNRMVFLLSSGSYAEKYRYIDIIYPIERIVNRYADENTIVFAQNNAFIKIGRHEFLHECAYSFAQKRERLYN